MKLQIWISSLIIINYIPYMVFAKSLLNGDSKEHDRAPEENICTTPACAQAATRILSRIDETVDPCSNFYRFACGGYLRTTIIPDDKTQVSDFSELDDALVPQLKTLLEEPSSINEIRPFLVLKAQYRSCLDTIAIEKDNFETIKKLLKKVGGWPILEGINWNEKDWQKYIYQFRKYGLSNDDFIQFSLEPDLKNSTQILVKLDQPDVEIARNNMLGGLYDEVVQVYYKYILEVALEFGANGVLAENDIKEMLEFRRQLANISDPDEERRKRFDTYHTMTIKVLQKTSPDIKWLDLINDFIAIPEKYLTEDDVVNVGSLKYISNVADVLRRTSKRAQANHAIIHNIRNLEMYLPNPIRDLEQKFKQWLSGSEKRPPRWRECVDVSSDQYDLLMSALYVRNYFKEETKQAATEMVKDIKEQMLNIIEKAEWMDEETRKLAIKKALAIKSFVGYPSELLDDKKLDEVYANLFVNSNNCLLNYLNASVFFKNFEMSLLGVPLNNSDWKTRIPAITINAAYMPHENSIQIPAITLQNIFFNKDRLKALNYGAIGYFIGHEITHGFDDQGREFNKDGNYEQWWAEDTNKAFLNKAQCIIDEYSNYTVPEVNKMINGINTQGENIADSGGVKQAYLAYSSWIKRNGEEAKLPGLKYTPKQLFWISAANSWCTLERPESLKLNLLLGNHSPAEFRVIGPLSNSEYFSRDFQCPVGSKMNPQHKCRVW